MQHRDTDVRQVWAVVRVDDSTLPVIGAADLEARIKVTAVLSNESLAASEVRRLNQLNSPKGAFYFYQATRLREHDAL